MATNAERLNKLRALYDLIVDNLLAAETLGSDTISVDGVTLSTDAAYAKLEKLKGIPGVVPVEPFTVITVSR